jgi:hypothetical protein
MAVRRLSILVAVRSHLSRPLVATILTLGNLGADTM